MSLLDVGLSSLFASKYALSVTNQNIANAGNPFYTRRVVDFQEAYYGSGGDGVKLQDIRRMFDEVTNRNQIRSTSDFASAESYHQQFKGFESLLDNSGTSVASYIKHSLTQLNSLNTNPSSMQSRNMYLAQLNNIANRFNQVSQQINQERVNVNQAIVADVAQVNLITQQIAQINGQILESGTPGSPDNMPLMDERDRLLNKMAEYIDFNSTTDIEGATQIQLANGVPLISGNKANTIKAISSRNDPSALDIAVYPGGSAEVITSFISGGKLSAALAFQQNGLNSTEMGLDRLALAMAFKMNEQHQLGVDLNGQLGVAVFKDMNSVALSNNRVSPEATNAGTGTISVNIDDVTKLALSDYQLIFSTGSQYQMIRLSDNQMVSSGNIASVPFSLSADGFSINITSANFVAGDKFTVSPTHGAASSLQVGITNPSQLALGFPVITSPSDLNTGKGGISLDSITDTTTSAFALSGELSPPIVVEMISATSYRLLSATDGSVIANNQQYDSTVGASIFPTSSGYDPGYRVSLRGEMHTGDQFQINYNQAGLGDNRNGLSLENLFQQGVLDGETLSFIQGYNAIIDDVSTKTNIAKMGETSQGIIKSQAELRRDQLSGVSLEEEAMNIARYQESYKASAQILDTVRTMFDVVLNLMRR